MRRYWLAGVFLYILASGALVQFVILPHCLPSMHDGAGLLTPGDSSGFHRAAVERAALIREKGWSTWTLRPAQQSPVGIASAMYALVGISKPWTVLPVNAALWTFSAWILFRILRPMVSSDTLAILGTLPFIAAPSALVFLTQIHKDPFVIAGTLAIWLALFRLAAARKTTVRGSEAVRMAAWMIGGLVLLWVGRPYTVYLALFGYGVAGLVLLLADCIDRRIYLAVWVVIGLSLALCIGLGTTKDAQEYAQVGSKVPRRLTNDVVFVFQPSCLGPLDQPFRRMALMRAVYLGAYLDARSKLDEDAVLDSSWKVMAYSPRALQLLLLAPFPTAWFHRERATPFSLLLHAETALRYLLLPGLAWLAWRKRRELAFWVPWLFFVPLGLISAITTPNLGTLVRIRFPLVMILASFGFVGTIHLLEAWRKRAAVK